MNQGAFTATTFALHAWLEAWLNGAELFDTMFEYAPATVINPFTRRPTETRRPVRALGSPFEWVDEGLK